MYSSFNKLKNYFYLQKNNDHTNEFMFPDIKNIKHKTAPHIKTTKLIIIPKRVWVSQLIIITFCIKDKVYHMRIYHYLLKMHYIMTHDNMQLELLYKVFVLFSG